MGSISEITNFQELALQAMQNGLYEVACEHFKNAADALQLCDGPRDARVLSLYHKLGSAQLLAQQDEEAFNTLSRIANVYYELWKEGDGVHSLVEPLSVITEVIQLCNKLGEIEQYNSYVAIMEEMQDSRLYPYSDTEPTASHSVSEDNTHIVAEQTIKIGDHVEVRAMNEDELFYGAKVVDYDSTKRTFSVLYEDNTIGDNIFAHSILGNDTRRIVHETDSLKVMDGHVMFEGKLRSIRLLRFVEEQDVFQSGVLLQRLGERPEDAVVDRKAIPFVVNQALAMSVPFTVLCQGSSVKSVNSKLLLLGTGGGSLPMSLCAIFPKLCIEMVDNSDEVLTAAKTFFGLGECINPGTVEQGWVRLEHTDAIQHIDEVLSRETSDRVFDIVVVDIAIPESANSSVHAESELDGVLDLPPKVILESEILEKFFKIVGDNGVVVINVLGEDEAIKQVATRLKNVCDCCHALVVDPNIVFFMTRNKNASANISKEQLIQVAKDIGIETCCAEVIQIIEEDQATLGFFDCQHLISRSD